MKRLSLYILLISGVFLSGCKKEFLELTPYNRVPLEAAFKTEGDMLAATNGIYTQLRVEALYGRDQILRGDLMADNVYISSTNSNRFVEYFQYNFTISSATVLSAWTGAYNAILRANNVINSELPATPVTRQYKGEALMLRSLMYFELVRLYGKPFTVDPNALGVPIVLTYDISLKPSRSTVKQVYEQIEKDLAEAITLLTTRTPYSSAYVSQYAAKAFLARVYQHKGEWAKALTTAQDVINTGGYTLTTTADHLSYWSAVAPRTDKVESLFELSFNETGNIGNASLPYFFAQSGYGDALASDDLFNSFRATDVRRSLIIDAKRGGKDVKVVNKYPNNSSPNKDDMKILRLSEVYLIAAEAAYHTNNPVQALTYLNDIATRRDPTFSYSSSGTQLLEDILTERRKELAFEGHRYWDLVRYNRDVVRVNTNTNYPSNVPLVISTTNFRRILPIPQTELDANPTIKNQQNSGY